MLGRNDSSRYFFLGKIVRLHPSPLEIQNVYLVDIWALEMMQLGKSRNSKTSRWIHGKNHEGVVMINQMTQLIKKK